MKNMLKTTIGIRKYGFTKTATMIEPSIVKMFCVESRIDFGNISSIELKMSENISYQNDFIEFQKCTRNLPDIFWKSIKYSARRIRVKKSHCRWNDSLEHRIMNILGNFHTNLIKQDWSLRKKYCQVFLTFGKNKKNALQMTEVMHLSYRIRPKIKIPPTNEAWM